MAFVGRGWDKAHWTCPFILVHCQHLHRCVLFTGCSGEEGGTKHSGEYGFGLDINRVYKCHSELQNSTFCGLIYFKINQKEAEIFWKIDIRVIVLWLNGEQNIDRYY